MDLDEIIKDLEHTIEYFKNPKNKVQVGRKYQAEKTLAQLLLCCVVGQREQLSLSDFRVGFEYEELQMDSERYLNKGMIWVKKIYGLNSPRLHKIQKLLDEGKLRKA